jgi:hypothetical protein
MKELPTLHNALSGPEWARHVTRSERWEMRIEYWCGDYKETGYTLP